MKIIKNISKFKIKNSVVALGTFDGVHLGHKRVILSAVKYAKSKNLPCVVITFNPHPLNVIRNVTTKLLTTIDERAFFVSQLGVDYMLVLNFTKKFSLTSYKKFVGHLLVEKLKIRAVFVGKDYCFGKNKEGNLAKLKILGEKFGFEVFGVKDKIEHNKVVKSSLIRTLLQKSNFAHAINLLGHPYLIKGKVVKGLGLGTKLGYPTANIEVPQDKLLPSNGVYGGYVLVGNKRYKCVVNIGIRPTFALKEITVETHILNFKGNIMGKKIFVFLSKWLRKEKNFLSIKELIKAIERDVKVITNNHTPCSYMSGKYPFTSL